MNPLANDRILRVTFGLILVLALAMRVVHITADPPHYFAGLGQALITDPYHITHFARNKALFGDWDPFDYDRWVAFRVSLVSGFSWLVFAIAGVSRATANLSSILLNLFSITLVFGAILAGDKEQNRARLAALLASGLLAVSHLFIVYSREPFLENGLIALASLVMFVTLRYGRTLIGAALAGALVPLCPLAGKLFGLAIIAPALATLWLDAEDRVKRIAVFFAGALASALLWLLVVLGSDADAYFAYLREQSLGLYGFPPGLTSPLLFVSQAMSFGAESRIFEFQLLLPLALTVTLSWFVYRRFNRRFSDFVRYARENRALAFLFVWAVVVWLGLMPFHYRPVRYTLFALFPAIALVGGLIADTFTDSKRVSGRFTQLKNMTLVAVALFGSWYTITQARVAILGNELTRPMVEPLVWSSLIFAPLGVVTLWSIRKLTAKYNDDIARKGLIAFLAVMVVGQGLWYARMVSTATYDIQRFSHELGEIVDQGAVLTAPHAPNLALDTKLKTVIYSFGLARDDRDLFKRFPITHLVADVGNIEQAEKKFPEARNSLNIARTVFRDATVDVMRLRSADNAPMTGYEMSLAKAYSGQFDEALVLANKFSDSHPDNAIALRNYIDIALRSAKDSVGLSETRHLVELDAKGAWSLAYAARVMFYLSERLKDNLLIGEGEQYLERAKKLNPPAAEFFESYSKN